MMNPASLTTLPGTAATVAAKRTTMMITKKKKIAAAARKQELEVSNFKDLPTDDCKDEDGNGSDGNCSDDEDKGSDNEDCKQ